MPWGKVDDKLHDHAKAHAAGKSAMGVWVMALSWSADNLTDGFIPQRVLGRWGTTSDARKLVGSGLWDTAEKAGEKGWQFHDWADYQPTKADVDERRRKNADKLAAWRAKRDQESANEASA